MSEPVRRTMAVFCDETGTHDCDYFGWGSIWCSQGRVEEFERTFRAMARRHRVKGEAGWKFAGNSDFQCELVRWFFEQRWMCFQALFVHKPDMRIFTERGSKTAVAYQKLLCTLVATQAARFDALPGGPRGFHIHVDSVSQSSAVTAEEYRIVAAAVRKRSGRARGQAPVATFERVDSRSSPGVQLADLLVGAIRYEWEHRPAPGKGKQRAFRGLVARCLGWSDLRATTSRNLKFNIWLHNDCAGFKARPVRLLHPHGDPQPSFGPRG